MQSLANRFLALQNFFFPWQFCFGACSSSSREFHSCQFYIEIWKKSISHLKLLLFLALHRSYSTRYVCFDQLMRYPFSHRSTLRITCKPFSIADWIKLNLTAMSHIFWHWFDSMASFSASLSTTSRCHPWSSSSTFLSPFLKHGNHCWHWCKDKTSLPYISYTRHQGI